MRSGPKISRERREIIVWSQRGAIAAVAVAPVAYSFSWFQEYKNERMVIMLVLIGIAAWCLLQICRKMKAIDTLSQEDDPEE